MKKIVPFTKEINFKTMISKISSISLEHTLKVNDNNTISGYFIVDGKYKMTQASQIDEEFSYKIPVDIEIDTKYDTSNIELDIDDFTYEVLDEDKVVLNISLCIDNLVEKEEIIDVTTSEKNDDEDDSIDTDDNNISDEDADRANDLLNDLFLETTKEQELVIPEEKEDEVVNNNNINITNDIIFDQVSNNQDSNVENNIEQYSNNKDIDTNSGMDSLFSSFKDSVETFKTYSVYIMKEEDTLNTVLTKYNIDKESLEEYNDLSNITSGSKIIIPCGKNE